MDPPPKIFGDDAEVFGGDANPLSLGDIDFDLSLPTVLPLFLAVNDAAKVEVASEHFANTGRGPATTAGRGNAIRVETLGNAKEPHTVSREGEDAANDVGLRRVDFADNVIALLVARPHLDIAVAVDYTAR